MNYYYIQSKDQQYGNCLYLSKINKRCKLNDADRSFIIPNDIKYTFSEEMYKQFKEEIKRNKDD